MTAQPDLWSQRIHVYANRKPLGKQTQAVYDAMRDGDWWTFAGLRMHLGFHGIGVSEAGVSARIRDLRKPPLNLKVERRTTSRKGIWEYRVIL